MSVKYLTGTVVGEEIAMTDPVKVQSNLTGGWLHRKGRIGHYNISSFPVSDGEMRLVTLGLQQDEVGLNSRITLIKSRSGKRSCY